MNNIKINTNTASKLLVSYAYIYGWTTYKQMHTALHKAKLTSIFALTSDNHLRCAQLRKVLNSDLEYYLKYIKDKKK